MLTELNNQIDDMSKIKFELFDVLEKVQRFCENYKIPIEKRQPIEEEFSDLGHKLDRLVFK